MAVTAVLVVFIQAEQCDCVIFTNHIFYCLLKPVRHGSVVYAADDKIAKDGLVSFTSVLLA